MFDQVLNSHPSTMQVHAAVDRIGCYMSCACLCVEAFRSPAI